MTTHIRIPDISPVAQDLADGSRRLFRFPFPIFAAADLEVMVGNAVVSGYEVSGEGSSKGGAVEFPVAPAAGLRVTIRRRQTYARTEDFLDERAPTPHELNDAVDQNVAAIQELAEENSRAVHRSPSADLSRPVNLALPEPEAGKVIGWNGSADALVNLTQVDASDMLRKSQNLADLPDKAQARINLGLGSAAVHGESDFATAAQGAKADSALQPSAIGSTVQAFDADLAGIAALSFSQGDLIYHNGTAPARLAAGTAGQVLRTNGPGANPAWAAVSGAAPTMTVITSTGTWTKPAGLTAVVVEIVGGGGGGGGAAAVSGGALASGGGGGGYSRKRIAAASLGATETVTVGDGGAGGNTSGSNGAAGGTSSFGAHCSASGGDGGNGITTTAAFTIGAAGGAASGGDVNIPGGRSPFAGDGTVFPINALGDGGDAALGFGSGGRRTINLNAPGVSGSGFGSGGSGGWGGAQTGGKTGGAGTPGIIIVWEFF